MKYREIFARTTLIMLWPIWLVLISVAFLLGLVVFPVYYIITGKTYSLWLPVNNVVCYIVEEIECMYSCDLRI
jgi:hypothetical protein